MRTTVRLDEQLLAQAKRLAAEKHCTLTAVIEDALREKLARRKAVRDAPRIELIRYGKGGLRPGVTLDSNAELLDLMEQGDDAPRASAP